MWIESFVALGQATCRKISVTLPVTTDNYQKMSKVQARSELHRPTKDTKDRNTHTHLLRLWLLDGVSRAGCRHCPLRALPSFQTWYSPKPGASFSIWWEGRGEERGGEARRGREGQREREREESEGGRESVTETGTKGEQELSATVCGPAVTMRWLEVASYCDVADTYSEPRGCR